MKKIWGLQKHDFWRHSEASKSASTQTVFSESVSAGVWCVPGFGAGVKLALEPSKLQKKEKILEKDAVILSAPNPALRIFSGYV